MNTNRHIITCTLWWWWWLWLYFYEVVVIVCGGDGCMWQADTGSGIWCTIQQELGQGWCLGWCLTGGVQSWPSDHSTLASSILGTGEPWRWDGMMQWTRSPSLKCMLIMPFKVDFRRTSYSCNTEKKKQGAVLKLYRSLGGQQRSASWGEVHCVQKGGMSPILFSMPVSWSWPWVALPMYTSVRVT